MTAKLPRVGFIGLGNMGWPMAGRLAAAGYPLSVYDAAPERTQEFAREFGASVAADPAGVADQAEFLVTILPNSDIVGRVMNGPVGAISRMAPGAVVIEMSSGVPSSTRSIAKAVEAAGGHLVDAPVSGGVPRAKTGDLAIMIGGDAATVARADPLLRQLGSSIVHTGDVGTAHAMKALNNLVSAAGFLVGVEAMLVGQKFGLAPDLMVDILNASSGKTNSSEKKFKQFVLSRAFNAGFGLDLMVKDLTIAMDIASETGTPVPFSGLCREMWAAAAQTLGPGQDHTAVAKWSETLAGATLQPQGGSPPAGKA